MDLPLLRSPVFAACFLMTAVRPIALYGGTFLLPVFLQNFKGYDEVQSGLILLPGSLLMGLLMPIGGRLGDKMSPRLLALIGFLLLGYFFFEYRNLSVESSYWDIVWPTMIRGVGVAILIAPLTATAMNALPTSKAGMASSMLNIIQQVGGSIGIAALSLVLHRRSIYHMSIIGADVSPSSSIYRETFTRIFARAHELGYSHAESAKVAGGLLAGHAGTSATVLGFQDSFLFGAVLTFAVIAGVFLLPNRPIHHAVAEPVHLE